MTYVKRNFYVLVLLIAFFTLLKLLIFLFADYNAKPAIEVIILQHKGFSDLDIQKVLENFTFTAYSAVTYPFYLLTGDSIYATRTFNALTSFFILFILLKYTNNKHSLALFSLVAFYPAIVYYSMYELRDVFLSFLVLMLVLSFAELRRHRYILIVPFLTVLVIITRPEISAGLVASLAAVSLLSRRTGINALLLFFTSLLLLPLLLLEVNSTLGGASFLEYYQARANIQYLNEGAGSSVLSFKNITSDEFTPGIFFEGVFLLFFPFFHPDLELEKKIFYSVDALIFLYVLIRSLTIKINKESIVRYRIIQWSLLANIFILSLFISNYMNFLRIKMPLVVGLIGALIYFSGKCKKA